jgi:hypothetical protein
MRMRHQQHKRAVDLPNSYSTNCVDQHKNLTESTTTVATEAKYNRHVPAPETLLNDPPACCRHKPSSRPAVPKLLLLYLQLLLLLPLLLLQQQLPLQPLKRIHGCFHHLLLLLLLNIW